MLVMDNEDREHYCLVPHGGRSSSDQLSLLMSTPWELMMICMFIVLEGVSFKLANGGKAEAAGDNMFVLLSTICWAAGG